MRTWYEGRGWFPPKLDSNVSGAAGEIMTRLRHSRKAISQMRIRVTQQDIDRGVQGNSFHCPVARAVKRAFKAAEVWVREIIIITKSGSRLTSVAPPEVEDFMERYDSAILEFESPRPFSFSLDATELIRPVSAGRGARARHNRG